MLRLGVTSMAMQVTLPGDTGNQKWRYSDPLRLLQSVPAFAGIPLITDGFQQKSGKWRIM
ncbi:MAG TPA: hypothetical protein DCY84_03335 [Firmicutes bacterium]|nr:hypothetical protein [Bacillota bacterium]HAZ21385.1 hypothetical protein [Bacillota bacterium]